MSWLSTEQRRRAAIFWIAALLLLAVIYLPTLLTQINGGDDPYMDDVGEIQVSLNVWGTIHHTGYPLYAILGNMTVQALKAVGVSPATAPCLYAMGWGFVALTAFYLLVLRLTRRAEIAAVATVVLGLARSIWIHNIVSEVYSMSFAFQAILLAIALWEPIAAANLRRRVWLLAFVGGLGVFHHRMVIFMAPGLLLAIWPGLRASLPTQTGYVFRTFAIALLIGLLGLIPYIYLPARALANADWVYGNPGTLEGFWHEFTGAEAAFLMHLPIDSQAWIADGIDTFSVLAAELTPLLAAAGGLALLWAMFRSRFRREAWIAFVCTLGYFAFLFVLHRVVMPQAVAMPIVMVLVLALAFALEGIRDTIPTPLPRIALFGATGLLSAILLISTQYGFIYRLTHNNTGLQMIDLAKHVPRSNGKSVLMFPWGPRYDAVAFSKFVTKANADLRIVTHKADFGAMSRVGDVFYTSKDTFYQFPPGWWDAQIGQAYLSSAAAGLVEIRSAPHTLDSSPVQIPVAHGIEISGFALCTDSDSHLLEVAWKAAQKPDADLSVFVHLLDAGGAVVAQADTSAPVYGWYPTSRWSAGELVYDNYVLPNLPEGVNITFGMYEQPTPGQFVNFGTQMVPILHTCKVLRLHDEPARF